MIKENARIIFNIINGIEDSFEKSSQEGNNLLLSKNEYSWCKNDQQMLEKLEKEIFDEQYGSELEESERQELVRRYQYYPFGQMGQDEEASSNSGSTAGELFSK